jgi:aminoglycoside N3'-acetyltransferase
MPDMVMTIAEALVRRIYWSWPGIRKWRHQRKRAGAAATQQCSYEDLRRHLQSVGVVRGALVMLHTRTTGLSIASRSVGSQASGWQVTELLLSLVSDLLGPTGTLTMPTNAKYQIDGLEKNGNSEDVPTYDPGRTPSYVGLANELFWRQKDTQRSLFPYNMLAARGPLAEELLKDNLNERKPSPHGVDSGYYRFCRLNGRVVSVGVPLRECLTLARVVEEVRSDWPIKDFFSEHRYRVIQNGIAREWVVRLTRDEYDKFCHCGRKMGRDLVSEGVIHETTVGNVRVDWAWAGQIFDFFWRKTETEPYPYYALWLARNRWRGELAERLRPAQRGALQEKNS